MKKNGFVFVETIVAVVILTSSLLLLYSTFSKILQSEKTRVYYDDVNYIYRTWYVKERINSLNIMAALRDITSNTDKYFVTVGIEYDNLFTGYEREKTYISNNLKKCTLECSLDSNCNDYENCNGLYTNLSDEMINYLKTIYIDVSCTYVMVIEYNTCSSDNTNCKSYYSWVSV